MRGRKGQDGHRRKLWREKLEIWEVEGLVCGRGVNEGRKDHRFELGMNSCLEDLKD